MLKTLEQIQKEAKEVLKEKGQSWGDNMVKTTEQVEEEIKKGIIKPIHPLQLFLNMLSMCIFPFMAKPMFEQAVGISKKQFDAMIDERKKLVPEFIIASIKK